MMELLGTVFIGTMLLVGSGFCLVAALGLIRFPDVYTRTHAASKAGTLGSGVLLVAIGLHAFDPAVAARAIAGFVFFLLTAPVSAHLLARAALKRGYAPTPETWINDFPSEDTRAVTSKAGEGASAAPGAPDAPGQGAARSV